MARPREFDETEVLDLARAAFWGQGVAATSIADLSEATGLSVGSLYKAFESKDRLCSLTLDDYLSKGRERLKLNMEQAETPWDGVLSWIDDIIDQAVAKSPTRGCYGVELAAERAAVDEEVRSLLVDHDSKVRRMISGAVTEAIADGRLSGDPKGITRLLLTTANGLQVESRKGISRAAARLTIDTLLAGFRSG